MNEEQNGRFEAIMKKVLAYKEESKDPMFTQYLASFQQRLISKQHEIDILGVELEEKHALYLQRKTQMEEGTLPLEADEALQEGTQVQAAQKAPKEQKTKKSGEFAIGTYAFSAVGMVFLLVSFGMLGKYFMNDFVKGVFLFAIAAIVYLIGEFILRKRTKAFHLVIGNLGVAAWYIAAYTNCDSLMDYHYGVAIALVVLFGAAVILLDRKRTGTEWAFSGMSAGAYYFGVITLWLLPLDFCSEMVQAIVLCALLVLARLLSLRFRFLRGADVALTVWASLFLLGTSGEWEGYIVFAVFVAMSLFTRFYHLFYQTLVTISSILFIAMSFENDITYAIVVAMIWLFMLLFNYVEVFRSHYTKTYNYIMWTLLAIIYLGYATEAEYMMWVITFIMTFLGVGVLLTTASDRFGINEKYRAIACGVFLTVMLFMFQFTYDVTVSILLMVIGVGSIGAGFYIKDKILRIYGLVVALIVCFKITLFDFADGESLERMILFFAAGAISLVISGIYVLLEKKDKKNSNHSGE